MVRSIRIVKLLSWITLEMHIQSSVQGGKKKEKKSLIVILCVMRWYWSNHYSTATILFEREVHYVHCQEVPQTKPRALLILWIRNERMAAGTIEPLHFFWVHEHLVTGVGYCSLGCSSYPVQQTHSVEKLSHTLSVCHPCTSLLWKGFHAWED